MKSYILQGLEVAEKYKVFVRYMSAYSSAFSLVFFRHNENEKINRTTKTIQKRLVPYLIACKRQSKLPSMITANQFQHIYELSIYQTCFETIDVLETAHSIFDWDYPNRPMDLSFFRNGYAWFSSSAHEKCCMLYTDDLYVVQDLQDMGLQIIEKDDMDVSSVYFDEDAFGSVSFVKKPRK